MLYCKLYVFIKLFLPNLYKQRYLENDCVLDSISGHTCKEDYPVKNLPITYIHWWNLVLIKTVGFILLNLDISIAGIMSRYLYRQQEELKVQAARIHLRTRLIYPLPTWQLQKVDVYVASVFIYSSMSDQNAVDLIKALSSPRAYLQLCKMQKQVMESQRLPLRQLSK